MKLRTASALAAVAATLVVAGCGSDDAKTTSSSAKTPDPYGYDYGSSKTQEKPAAESETGIAAKLSIADGRLVDATGRTLYLWEADQGDQSACDGACAAAWPPLTTNVKPEAGTGVDASLLGTSKRADGTTGVTYAGHPLYSFTGDQAAGDVNGKGSDGFGAKWWPVAADGAAIDH
jgi:predicted lipoprotein with Yx(FWY)xxD motif